MENKENQRTRLTKRLLKEALIDILQTTSFSALTITEICNKAEVNRTTFYKYYSNECELYYDIEKDFIDQIRFYISQNNDASLEMLLTTIYDNPKVSHALFNNNIGGKLSHKLFSLPEIANSMRLKSGENLPDYDRLCFFIFNGGYAIIKDWINNGYNASPRELSDFIISTVGKLLKN